MNSEPIKADLRAEVTTTILILKEIKRHQKLDIHIYDTEHRKFLNYIREAEIYLLERVPSKIIESFKNI